MRWEAWRECPGWESGALGPGPCSAMPESCVTLESSPSLLCDLVARDRDQEGQGRWSGSPVGSDV